MHNELAVQGFSLTTETELYDVDGGAIISATVISVLQIAAFLCGIKAGIWIADWLGF